MMKQCDINETNFKLRFSIRQMNIIVIYMIIDIYMRFLIHVKLIYNNPYFNPFFHVIKTETEGYMFFDSVDIFDLLYLVNNRLHYNKPHFETIFISLFCVTFFYLLKNPQKILFLPARKKIPISSRLRTRTRTNPIKLGTGRLGFFVMSSKWNVAIRLSDWSICIS